MEYIFEPEAPLPVRRNRLKSMAIFEPNDNPELILYFGIRPVGSKFLLGGAQ